MKTTWMRFLMGAILLTGPCAIWAQQCSANRKVILRRDPSTASPALGYLDKGARLTLIDATADAGFYHVRTENDEVGWVYAKYISMSKASTPTPAEPITASGAQCDANLWSHVYYPQRLIVNKQCAEVTGTIVDATNGRERDGVRHEQDGDTHGWLNVDSQFKGPSQRRELERPKWQPGIRNRMPVPRY